MELTKKQKRILNHAESVFRDAWRDYKQGNCSLGFAVYHQAVLEGMLRLAGWQPYEIYDNMNALKKEASPQF